MKKIFPKDFFWGAANASYQVEGGIYNTDWSEAVKQGRVPICGEACDHYNRYKDDFRLAQILGHTAHRFSIEWSRVEPEEGKFSTEAIEHYKSVLRSLRQLDITPYITLWHFTLPQWFAESGGFERPDSPAIFARYCGFVVHQLCDLCEHFSTINEPNVYTTHGYIYGAWPPFKQVKFSFKTIRKEDGTSQSAREANFKNIFSYFKVEKNLIKAHQEAYRTIKKICPTAQVSIVKHVRVFLANQNPIRRLQAFSMRYLQTYRFMNAVVDYVDEIGVNYYRISWYGAKKEWKKTDMGWNFVPEYIYEALMMLKHYNKPLFIAEGGLADHDDSDRAEYITKQVAGVWRAIKHGVDVRGHFYWSLLDNYEWALGFEKRFGLIAVDFKTQKRTIRSSAYVYKEIITNNGLIE